MARTEVKQEKRVPFNVPSSGLNEDREVAEYETTYINGFRIQMKKDEDVMVAPIVKELYEENKKRLRQANTKVEIALQD